MQQESQQDHGREQIGQVLFAVAKVVIEMIPLGLEGIVVFVLDFPARTTGRRAPSASGVSKSANFKDGFLKKVRL